MSFNSALRLTILGLVSIVAAPVAAGTFSTAVLSAPTQLQFAGGGGLTFGQNTGTTGTATVNGITYTSETYFTNVGSNQLGGGSSFSNSNLNLIMQNGRYGNSLTANVPVVPGVTYNLQLLFWDPVNTYVAGSRKMDITAEGDTLTGLDVIGTTGGWAANLGALVNYSFTAGDSTLNLSIVGNGGTQDPYAILNGFSLVPEPSTITLVGLAVVGLCAVRRRRR